MRIDWNNKNYNKEVVDKLKNLPKINGAFSRQIEAAINTILSWSLTSKDRNNHTILWSRTQAGKTGVNIAIVNILKSTGLDEYFGIEKFYFICGMNTNKLHEQTFERILKDIRNNMSITNDDLLAHHPEIDGFKHVLLKQLEDKPNAFIYVLKNSHLAAINNSNVYSIQFEKCLILLDEVQYGQNEGNVLTDFINNSGIDYKNRENLSDKNIYITSISATPYDEIYSDTVGSKNVIELGVDNGFINQTMGGYIGASDFLFNNQIIDANGKIENIRYAINDALKRMNEDNINGICFIRTNQKNTDLLIKEFDITQGGFFNCQEINAKGGKIDFDKIRDKYELLITAPNQKPIIFFIKGAFRAGDTLTEGHDKYPNLQDKNIKDYVYLVYDYSKIAEATIQGLLGRLTGYRKTCLYAGKTLFYVNKQHVIDNSEHEKNPKDREKIPSTKNGEIIIEDINDFNPALDKIKSELFTKYIIPLTNQQADEILSISGETYESFINKWIKENYSLIQKYNDNELEYDYIGENFISGINTYSKSVVNKWFNQKTINSLKKRLNINDIGKKYIHTILHGDKINGYKLVIWNGILVPKRKTNYRNVKQIKNTNITEVFI